MKNHTMQPPGPLLTTFVAFMVLITAPLWMPLAMCISIATGLSLKNFNTISNRMSGCKEEEEIQ
jgi:hypothetical protein